eukprot:1138347_1
MTPPFPTRNELKCSGCSFIFAHVLLIGALVLFAADYDIYNVSTEEEVTLLHNAASSQAHRVEIEVCAALMWLSYPFLLMGLAGIKSLIEPIYNETGGRMLVFVIEKAYLMWITIVIIVIPALALTSVSFEWSFHEYTPEPDVIPTGYYIQLYTNVLLMEVFDCVTIADATFLLSMFILPRFLIRNPKFKKLKAAFDPDLPKCLQNMRCFIACFNIFTIALGLTCFILFMMILFDFAESGFFSPVGYAKFLTTWSLVLKMLIGLRLFVFGSTSQYDKLKQVFDRQRILDDAGVQEQDMDYQIEEVDPQTVTR